MSGKFIALIPARGGSKRFPGKNIQLFNGQPLASWTLEFACDCKLFDDVYLNTDMNEIHEIAIDEIQMCPRPENLAHDSATLLDVIRYTCMKEQFDKDDIIALLPVTGPLRIAEDLKKGIELFKSHKKKTTIVSVNINPYPVGMLWDKDNDENLSPLFPDKYNTTLQKQRHKSTYQFNDLFVIDSAEGFLKPKRNLFGAKPLAVVIPPERSMPIDYEYQFVLAEALHRIGLASGIFKKTKRSNNSEQIS